MNNLAAILLSIGIFLLLRYSLISFFRIKYRGDPTLLLATFKQHALEMNIAPVAVTLVVHEFLIGYING